MIAIFASRLYLPVECVHLYDLGKKTITGFFMAFFFLAALFFFIDTFIAHNWHIFFPLLFIFLSIFLFRCVIFCVFKENRERILILGITEQAVEIVKEARNKKIKGYDIVGFVTSLDSQLGSEIQGLPVFGTMNQLEAGYKSP